MNKKLFKIIPLLIAAVMLFSLGSVVLAEEGEDAEGSVVETGGDTPEVIATQDGETEPAAEDDSKAEEASAEEGEGVITTGEDSEAQAGTESAAATESADESAAATESAAESAADAESIEESTEEETGSGTIQHLPRLISLGVIVLLAAVLFVLAKTNTKIGQRIAKFFREYMSEIKKISWYNWKSTLKATGVVLVILIAMAIVIGLLDFGFTSLIRLIANLF